MIRTYRWVLTWAGTLGAVATVYTVAEFPILANYFKMVARGPLREGTFPQMLAYYAQNVAVDFIFLAAAAGLAAVAFAFLRGKKGAGWDAWPLSVASVALLYLLFLTPVNFYFIGRAARFVSPWSLALNGGLLLCFVGAVFPARLLCKFYFRRLAGLPLVRAVQAAGVAAVVFSAAYLAWPLTSPPPASATPASRPNVVIVVLDALRADALSCYGSTLATPNIDRFASAGCRFENAYSCAPQTNRSVMTMFTSQYPTVHKARIDAAAAGGWEALAEVLSREGYYCEAVIGNDVLRPALGFGRGFDDYWLATEPGIAAFIRETVIGGIYRRVFRKLADRGAREPITELVTDRTVKFVDEYDYGRPFFLYVHYMDPHMPYTPPPEYVRRVPGCSEKVIAKLAADADFTDTYEYTDSEVLRTLYLGEVAYVDARLGRVFSAFERHHLYDNTIFVVTADHGEMFREHGYLGHNTHYREVIRVPLIIRAPAGPLAEARRYDGAVSLADLAPTIYAFAGVTPPPGLEGADMAALAAAPRPERFVYSETRTFGDEPKALHSARFTIIEDREKGRFELYDRADDPEQRLNRYRFDATLSADMLARVRRARGAAVEKAARSGEVAACDLGRDETSRLRSLGYVRD